MSTEHVPSQHVIDFCNHVERLRLKAHEHQVIACREAMVADDDCPIAAREVQQYGFFRMFCRHALIALEPRRFGETPERINAAEQSLEILDLFSEVMANIVRNATDSNAFIFAIGDVVNLPVRENYQKGSLNND